jgi:MFS family permease
MGYQKERQGPDRPANVQRKSLFRLCRYTIHVEWYLVRRPDVDSHLSHPRRGRSPSATGILLAPLGLGMMCGYPFIGTWVKWFGNRRVSVGGASLALAGTLPFIYMAGHGQGIVLLACSLFIRGIGMSAVGVPSVSAAYSSVKREDLPMATTTLNIVMRIGGPTLTTICATFLGWRLGFAPSHEGVLSAYTAAFILLCAFHGLLIAAAMRIPLSVKGGTDQDRGPARIPD